MLELRLNILDPVVDHFVICEAGETHSGQPKPFHLDGLLNTRFKTFAPKITYVTVDNLTGQGRDSWSRERFHRALIATGLTAATSSDWVLVSDCDEIVDPQVLRLIKNSPTYADMLRIKFELAFYYYDFNHRVQQGWSVGMSRWGVDKDPNKIRTNSGGEPDTVFNPAGWHFSYFSTAEGVIEKVNAFMHHADPGIKDLPRDANYIRRKMNLGVDLYDRPIEIKRVDLEPTLPKYVLENLHKYWMYTDAKSNLRRDGQLQPDKLTGQDDSERSESTA